MSRKRTGTRRRGKRSIPEIAPAKRKEKKIGKGKKGTAQCKVQINPGAKNGAGGLTVNYPGLRDSE